MYKRQNGVLPLTASVAGTVLLLIGILVSLNFGIPYFGEHALQQPFSLLRLLILLVVIATTMLFFLSPLWYIGAVLVTLFPKVWLVERGVKYRVIVFTGLLKWDEVDHIIRLRNDYVALAINRRGFALFNGLYFNRVHALFIGHEQPVLLLAPGLKDRERLLQEVASRIRAAVISRVDDLYT